MVDGQVLEQAYREKLDENIISFLAASENMTMEDAMRAFYESKLAKKLDEDPYGIRYLDYRNLAQILKDTEPDQLEKLRA